MINEKSPGRPREGLQTKQVYSIRLEPRVYKWIIEKYGSLSSGFKATIQKAERELRKEKRKEKNLN